MTAITHQRQHNADELARIALKYFEHQTYDKQCQVFKGYAYFIAKKMTIKEQREWLEKMRKIEAEIDANIPR